MNEATKKVIEKIEKILSKTNNNSSQAEIETAFAMAQKLALKHGIDLSEVQERETAKNPASGMLNQEIARKSQTERVYDTYIYRVLAVCLKVRVVTQPIPSYGTARPRVRTFFLGEEVDVIFAQYLYNVLAKSFKRLYKEFLDAHNQEHSRPVQRSFFTGLEAGIIEANKQVEKEVLDQSTAIVLVKKETRVANFMKDQFPNLRTARSRVSGGIDSATQAGYAKGRGIKLNRGLK